MRNAGLKAYSFDFKAMQLLLKRRSGPVIPVKMCQALGCLVMGGRDVGQAALEPLVTIIRIDFQHGPALCASIKALAGLVSLRVEGAARFISLRDLALEFTVAASKLGAALVQAVARLTGIIELALLFALGRHQHVMGRLRRWMTCVGVVMAAAHGARRVGLKPFTHCKNAVAAGGAQARNAFLELLKGDSLPVKRRTCSGAFLLQCFKCLAIGVLMRFQCLKALVQLLPVVVSIFQVAQRLTLLPVLIQLVLSGFAPLREGFRVFCQLLEPRIEFLKGRPLLALLVSAVGESLFLIRQGLSVFPKLLLGV